jgi:hypothetical protein
MWRQQGGDEGDISFLESNPEMIDRHDVTVVAAEEAAEHHQRGTDDHRRLTKEIFDQHLALQQATPAASAEPSPAFFAPGPAPAPAAPDRAAMYSAPVSRREAGSPREQSPSSMKLSPAEVEIAKASGISDVEYARQKQKLAQAKASGEYGELR